MSNKESYFEHPMAGKTPEYMRDPKRLRTNIVTFFFQGHVAARSQAALYTGPEGVNIITEHGLLHVHCIDSPRLLHNVYTYHELDDIGYETYNPFKLGLKCITHLENKYKNIEGSPGHYVNITHWNVGGHDDVTFYIKYFREMLQNTPSQKKIVLFGCSRGAATTFIAVSMLTSEEQDRISLIILEAPFDSLPNVLNSWPKLKVLAPLQLKLMSIIGSYHNHQLTPLDVVGDFPINIPVAFITSDQDKTVPKELTLHLVNILRDRGWNPVYHLELRESHHVLFPINTPNDQQLYYEFLDSLYDKYTTN